MGKLDGKVVVITGGASGIGLATAKLFAREGAMVAIADLGIGDSLEKAEKELFEASNQIVSVSGGATVVAPEGTSSAVPLQRYSVHVCDVTSETSVDQMVESVKKRYGRVDIMICNAGITADKTIGNMTHEMWDRVVAVNQTGVFHCMKAASAVMKEQKSGVILSTSSVVALYGNAGQVNYTATKAAVIAMTKSLAKEMGRHGVRVNAVAPGFIETPMTAKMPPEVLASMKKASPLGIIGKPENIAEAFLYLATAEFVTATVLSVDGGITT